MSHKLYIKVFGGVLSLGLALFISLSISAITDKANAACAPYQPCNVVGGSANRFTVGTTTTAPSGTRNMPVAGRTFVAQNPNGLSYTNTTVPVARTGSNYGYCPPYSPCNTSGGSPFRPTSYNYNRYSPYSGLNYTNWYSGRYGYGPSFYKAPGYRSSYTPRGSWNYTHYGDHHVTSVGSNGYYYNNWGRDFNFQIGL